MLPCHCTTYPCKGTPAQRTGRLKQVGGLEVAGSWTDSTLIMHHATGHCRAVCALFFESCCCRAVLHALHAAAKAHTRGVTPGSPVYIDNVHVGFKGAAAADGLLQLGILQEVVIQHRTIAVGLQVPCKNQVATGRWCTLGIPAASMGD